MADPKARKVILVENALLPTRVKEMIARILFENLQVGRNPRRARSESLLISPLSFPSGPFAKFRFKSPIGSASHGISHWSSGRLRKPRNCVSSGSSSCIPPAVSIYLFPRLVIQIYSSRPLFPNLLSTPLAGHRLNKRLRALLLKYGEYVAPPTSLISNTNSPKRGRIPKEVLSDELVEEIKNRCCFVGERLADNEEEGEGDLAEFFPDVDDEGKDGGGEGDDDEDPGMGLLRSDAEDDSKALRALYKKFSKTSKATTVSFKIPASASSKDPPPGTNAGRGWISIPGWVRERAAEVFFEGGNGDGDGLSLEEIVCESLLKVRPHLLFRP